MPQRAVSARLRVHIGQRADARRAVAHPDAQLPPAVRRIDGSRRFHRDRLPAAHHFEPNRVALRPADDSAERLRALHRFAVCGKDHVARAKQPALRRIGNDQHAARLERHADRLPAGNQPARLHDVHPRLMHRNQPEQRKGHARLPARLRAERHALILRGQHADRPARRRGAHRQPGLHHKPLPGRERQRIRQRSRVSHPWGIIAYKSHRAQRNAQAVPNRLFHAQSSVSRFSMTRRLSVYSCGFFWLSSRS